MKIKLRALDIINSTGNLPRLKLLVALFCLGVISVFLGVKAVGWFLLILLAGLIFISISSSWNLDAEPDWLSPEMIFAGTFILYIMAMPVIHLLTNYKTAFNDLVLLKTIGISIFGFACWMIGYFSNIGATVANRLPLFDSNFNNNKYVIFELLALCGVVLIYFLFSRGIIPPISLISIWLVRIGIALLLFSLTFVFSKGDLLSWGLLLFTGLLIFWGGFANSIVRERREAIKVLLGVAILFHYRVKRLSWKYVLPFGITIFILVYIIAILRFYGDFQTFYADILERNQEGTVTFLGFILENGDFAAAYENFQFILEKVPQEIQYLFGSSYLKPFVFWIPRTVWPSKPIEATQLIVNFDLPFTFTSGTSMAITIIGELFWNLGILGIAVGMFLAGVGVRVMKNYLELSNFHSLVVLLYAGVGPLIFELFRGGSSTIVLIFVAVFLIPYLLLVTFINDGFFLRRMQNRRAS